MAYLLDTGVLLRLVNSQDGRKTYALLPLPLHQVIVLYHAPVASQ